MSDQRWPNAILEKEWLALRWHMLGLLGYGGWTNIEPTVSNQVGPMSKMTSGRLHLSTSGLENANVGPTNDCYLGVNHLRYWNVFYYIKTSKYLFLEECFKENPKTWWTQTNRAQHQKLYKDRERGWWHVRAIPARDGVTDGCNNSPGRNPVL